MAKLEEIIWETSEERTAGTFNILGTVKELFGEAELFHVTKTDKERNTLMFRKDGKISRVLLSPAATKLFRAGKINLNQIMGLEVNKTAAMDGTPIMVAILPASGWIEVNKIKLVEYVAPEVALEDLIA